MSADRIRELNDAFRRSFTGGRVTMTAGVAALAPEELAGLLDRVRTFDRFDAGNDPHREHDFGAVELAGVRYFWKIDYFDPELKFGSEDPADPARTVRVLTVMLAAEY